MGQDAYNQAIRENEQNINDTIQNAATSALDKGTQYGLQAAQFGNSARNQLLNQLLSMQNSQNGLRQSALQEQAYLRNVPINDINALLRGAQGAQVPQFTPMANVSSSDAVPIANYINGNYQNQVNAYNSKMN